MIDTSKFSSGVNDIAAQVIEQGVWYPTPITADEEFSEVGYIKYDHYVVAECNGTVWFGFSYCSDSFGFEMIYPTSNLGKPFFIKATESRLAHKQSVS